MEKPKYKRLQRVYFSFGRGKYSDFGIIGKVYPKKKGQQQLYSVRPDGADHTLLLSEKTIKKIVSKKY